MRTVLALLIGAVIALPVWAGELTFTFIGNEAFHITDGTTTLLSDFPYRSGYYGYMEYEMENVPPIVDGVSLITHFHADHWSPKLWEEMDLKIIGPESITKRLDPKRVIESSPESPGTYNGIEVLPIPMKHMMAPDHNSYLVTWHGIRFYFVGDTETPADILQQKDIDVMFITPWLIRTIERQDLKLDAKQLFVYHQKVEETWPEFQNARPMKQGEAYVVEFEE